MLFSIKRGQLCATDKVQIKPVSFMVNVWLDIQYLDQDELVFINKAIIVFNVVLGGA